MRQFHKMIFMGNGKFSEAECQKLKERLQEGLSILSFLQQPSHPESDEEWELDKYGRRRHEDELENIVQDISSALLGREIVQLSEALPYP